MYYFVCLHDLKGDDTRRKCASTGNLIRRWAVLLKHSSDDHGNAPWYFSIAGAKRAPVSNRAEMNLRIEKRNHTARPNITKRMIDRAADRYSKALDAFLAINSGNLQDYVDQADYLARYVEDRHRAEWRFYRNVLNRVRTGAFPRHREDMVPEAELRRKTYARLMRWRKELERAMKTASTHLGALKQLDEARQGAPICTASNTYRGPILEEEAQHAPE